MAHLLAVFTPDKGKLNFVILLCADALKNSLERFKVFKLKNGAPLAER